MYKKRRLERNLYQGSVRSYPGPQDNAQYIEGRAHKEKGSDRAGPSLQVRESQRSNKGSDITRHIHGSRNRS